jgi:hypothetical protein
MLSPLPLGMDSRIKVAGHPLHPILIVFPFWLAHDDLHSTLPPWFRVTTIGFPLFWIIAAGTIGGFIAALPGLVDWLAIPNNTRAKAIEFVAWRR